MLFHRSFLLIGTKHLQLFMAQSGAGDMSAFFSYLVMVLMRIYLFTVLCLQQYMSYINFINNKITRFSAVLCSRDEK